MKKLDEFHRIPTPEQCVILVEKLERFKTFGKRHHPFGHIKFVHSKFKQYE